MKIILLAIRSLTRFRLYTWVNVLGLALSLACVIIISRYVYSEYTTDRGFENQERICLTVKNMQNGTEPFFFTSDNVLIQQNYVNPLNIPEVEKHTSFVSLKGVAIEVDQKLFEADLFATDTAFLQVFSYPLLEGGEAQLLQTPTSAVISKAYARKLFGKESPVGKTISYNETLLTIEGVVGDLPTKSSFAFDLLISKQLQWRWPPVDFHSAVLLYPGVDLKKMNEKIKLEATQRSASSYFQLFPLQKVYFDKHIDKGTAAIAQGNKENLQVLSFVGLLILAIGLLNFIYLYSVILLKRNRELSMKTVFGARPFQLFCQMYVENLVLTLLAVIIGWALIEITSGLQTSLLQIEIVNNPRFNRLFSLLVLFLIPCINSIYPFFKYSLRTPAAALKGAKKEKRKIYSQTIFLTAQYGITIFIIVLALFFMKQLHYMLYKDPGYRTQDVLKATFIRPNSKMYVSEEDEALETFIKQSVEKSPLFTASYFGDSPYELISHYYDYRKASVNGKEPREVYQAYVGKDFFAFFEIPVPQGALPLLPTDVLLNETAAKLLFGHAIASGQIEVDGHGKEAKNVKGVIPDIQTVHLSQQALPLILSDNSEVMNFGGKLNAVIAPGKQQEAIEFLRKLHAETIGGDFSYTFMEDEIRE
ncbi:ABC transporter permease, partial [Parabacteroides sp. OttesenSCG-928-O15]|nr:ABC transporter permease [Parabacteroides sp. OttesenSCG-928-O15]